MVKKYIQLRIQKTTERLLFLSLSLFFLRTRGSKNRDKGIIKDKQNSSLHEFNQRKI